MGYRGRLLVATIRRAKDRSLSGVGNAGLLDVITLHRPTITLLERSTEQRRIRNRDIPCRAPLLGRRERDRSLSHRRLRGRCR